MILIAIGVIGLVWGGITYTTRETVLDFGPIHATRDTNHKLPFPPIVGAVALVGGVALLLTGKKA